MGNNMFNLHIDAHIVETLPFLSMKGLDENKWELEPYKKQAKSFIYVDIISWYKT